MSVLFPALKAVGQGGPVFYLTARGTTRTAAENALALLRASEPHLKLRSVTLTAKDKICMQDARVYARSMPLCQRLLCPRQDSAVGCAGDPRSDR